MLISLVLVGCASQAVGLLAPAMTPPGIEFSVEQRPYGLGDTITIVLRNDSDRAIMYNLCHAVMERRDAEGWRNVSRRPPDPTGAIFFCPDVGILLASGRSSSAPQPVLKEMEGGIYRLRTDVFWGGLGGVETVLITNEFRVSG